MKTTDTITDLLTRLAAATREVERIHAAIERHPEGKAMIALLNGRNL